MPTSVILVLAAAIDLNIEGGSTIDAVNLGRGAAVLVLPPGVWVSYTVEKVLPSMVR